MGNWISFVDWCSLRNCGVCWRRKAAHWESVPLSAFGVRLAVERCCTYNTLHLVSRTIRDLEEFTEEKGRKEGRKERNQLVWVKPFGKAADLSRLHKQRPDYAVHIAFGADKVQHTHISI